MGVLGAARIAPAGILDPAGRLSDVEVTAIASRDRRRGRLFAELYNIATVYGGYEELLADPDIDAVYIALPNALHAEFLLRALGEGKHVLCEKPLAANHEEALLIEDEAAKHPDLVVMEAFHWRYHPLAEDILANLSELGPLRKLHVRFAFPLLRRHDIRWDFRLAGGAMMDVGCYAVSLINMIMKSDPQAVTANAAVAAPEIDRRMDAELLFPGGLRASLTASMLSTAPPGRYAQIEGASGRMTVRNPFAGHRSGAIRMSGTALSSTATSYPSERTTYYYQLKAFVAAIRGVSPNLTPPSTSVRNLHLIDAVYRAAGLPVRPSRIVPANGSPDHKDNSTKT
ncbi:Gfo/Idh/MocA family protein [Acrocarpospora phusangensis]|uniref:Gfo/Idh/MocA family protein n=1 Tax=Acrocarpospora phusangensis TaxID=1070424 RepID=UPI0019501E71|nr:Gfo/Idh/MocA family oxidoreductase [Acrocarpospora phusangensis]